MVQTVLVKITFHVAIDVYNQMVKLVVIKAFRGNCISLSVLLNYEVMSQLVLLNQVKHLLEDWNVISNHMAEDIISDILLTFVFTILKFILSWPKMFYIKSIFLCESYDSRNFHSKFYTVISRIGFPPSYVPQIFALLFFY